MSSSFLISTLEQSLIYGIMVLGVYITYKILDFPDLSVDGSFPLGASVTAYCIVGGMNPFLAIILATIAGAIAGIITGVLHVKLRITNLLSGILVMTGLYSVNLRIMGKPNTPLMGAKTIFSYNINSIVIIIIITILAKLLLDLFLSTKSGFVLRATGDNPQLVTSLGVDIGKAKIMGTMISNALVALAGSILAQHQGFGDAGMGTGIVVMGLASIIIGQSIFKRLTFFKATTAVLFGSIIFRLATAFALEKSSSPTDLKLMTAVVVIIFLGINNRGKDIKALFVGKKTRSGGEGNALNSKSM
ncbi:ABC-type uncharacterized transport system, permease component [Gottschalkia purinilytica]|uniref:ABC-type uncharacterized transport system, permease component n=1 Tax=Gottschalkia purinilytica TaxID=1503 RepID=A0A0L0WDN6_GOTPU|nr:ABC transporter permease [Gottschalkia purinilytica]KNF09589.1 ABC-type uncharacterized transport system, permease component [Gottschalkia purinilytica]